MVVLQCVCVGGGQGRVSKPRWGLDKGPIFKNETHVNEGKKEIEQRTQRLYILRKNVRFINRQWSMAV